MVDQPSLAWGGRSLCESAVVAQHVDEGGFPDIGPSDEREFRKSLLRFLGNPCAAAGKQCFGNFHFGYLGLNQAANIGNISDIFADKYPQRGQ